MFVCGAVLLPAAAPADSPVRVLPTRDVSVTYSVTGAAGDAVPALAPADGQAGVLRLAWDAAGQRLRIEADGRPEAAIIDLPSRRAEIVEPELRAAMALPMRARDVRALTLSDARMAPHGEASVLGHACTVWTVQAPRGGGTICLTRDGVALRGDGAVDGRHGAFVAIGLSYAAQPAELFAVPPGFTRLALPRFGHAE